MEWFRHDADAHDDIKIRKLLRKHGPCAYGAFWLIVELLYRNDGSASAQDIEDEFEMMGLPGMKEILADSGLFQISEDGSWHSNRVDEEVSYWDERRQKKVEAGRLGGLARASNAKAMLKQTQANSSTLQDNTEQLKKEVVSKDTPKKKSFQRPSLEEIKTYCQERNNSVDPQAFLDFYESKGWMIGKNHMKDWKAAVRTWEKADAKNPRPTYDTIKGTNIKMSLVADGTRGRFEPEVKFD